MNIFLVWYVCIQPSGTKAQFHTSSLNLLILIFWWGKLIVDCSGLDVLGPAAVDKPAILVQRDDCGAILAMEEMPDALWTLPS